MAVRYEFVTASGGPAKPAIEKFMKDLRKEILQAQLQLPVQTLKLSLQAGRFMAQRVRQLTKRRGATGELAKALTEQAIFKRFGKHKFMIEVGNTENLPPYWAMINYGGYLSPESVYGFWDDGTGKSDYTKRGGKGKGVFKAAGKAEGGSLMVPRKPIKGFHYIAYAHVRMLSYVERHFNIFKQGRG